MRKYISPFLLLLVNMVPLFGVVFLNWSSLHIIFLYWCELVVVLLYFTAKIAVAGYKEYGGGSIMSSTVLFVIFFGPILYAYLSILFKTLGPETTWGDIHWPTFLNLLIVSIPTILSFFISHGFSFFHNFISLGEYKKKTSQEIIRNALLRVFSVHFVVLIALFVSNSGGALGPLIVFVSVKTAVDLYTHLHEHRSMFSFQKV